MFPFCYHSDFALILAEQIARLGRCNMPYVREVSDRAFEPLFRLMRQHLSSLHNQSSITSLLDLQLRSGCKSELFR